MPEDIKENKTEKAEKKKKRSMGRKVLVITIRAVICIVLIAGGIAGAKYFKDTAPKSKKRPPQKIIPVVQVHKVMPGPHDIKVSIMGTIVPARTMKLKSRVSGQVEWIHPEFIEGGFFKAGTELIRLDQIDYKLDVIQKEAKVAEAKYALKLELGHQDVAKREWELLNDGKKAKELDRELALRKPHLEKAEANVAAAEADLKQARVHLSRTRIKVPFNAIVLAKNVDLGSQITTQEQLAELVGTDEYRVEASIPTDRLKWITIPGKGDEKGSLAEVTYRNGSVRPGEVIKLLSDLETEGRMARILISIKDPLGLKTENRDKPQVLLGEYVRAEIQGAEIEDTYEIPRAALRDDSHVWLLGEDNKLKIREVETKWRDAKIVLISRGLSPGDRVILSDLPSPVDGMPLQIKGKPAGKKGRKGRGKNA